MSNLNPILATVCILALIASFTFLAYTSKQAKHEERMRELDAQCEFSPAVFNPTWERAYPVPEPTYDF